MHIFNFALNTVAARRQQNALYRIFKYLSIPFLKFFHVLLIFIFIRVLSGKDTAYYTRRTYELREKAPRICFAAGLVNMRKLEIT